MNRRLISISLLAVLAVLIVYTHADETTSRFSEPPPAHPQGDATPPSIVFDGITLGRAVAKLSESSGVRIEVNWSAAEKAGVDPDAVVHLQCYGQPVEKILELLFVDATGDATNVPRQVQFYEGAIRVVFNPAACSELRLYDVQDLIQSFDPSRQGKTDAGALTTRGERADAVIGVILSVVDPDSWQVVGGAVGRVHDCHRFLIIQQTPDNHRRIENVLYNLRRIAAAREAGRPLMQGIDLLAGPDPAAR